MALTTTTLSAACAATDTQIKVTSATGFAVGYYVQLGEEIAQISKDYVAGSTTVPLSPRGIAGVPIAHPSGANVTVGVGSDWANAAATTVVAYPLAGRRRKKLEYAAAGAITLPVAGEDMVAILIGTNALAMTLAVPTKDNDGDVLTIVGNGKAAHTVTLATAIGNAGAGYTVLTFAAGGQIAVQLIAMNGIWTTPTAPAFSGTVTNIIAAIS